MPVMLMIMINSKNGNNKHKNYYKIIILMNIILKATKIFRLHFLNTSLKY